MQGIENFVLQTLNINQGYWFLIISYLIGSIPFGYVISKFFLGLDITKEGSGNIGMTNVIRSGGKVPGIFTFLLDFGKGSLCVFLPIYFNSEPGIILVSGFLAVFGHTRSIFLKFKGGKGVATNFGIWLVLDWRIFLITVGIWVLVFLLKKVSSLSAILSLISLPIVTYAFHGLDKIFILSIIITLFIIIKHHENIRRLIKGEENILKSATK